MKIKKLQIYAIFIGLLFILTLPGVMGSNVELRATNKNYSKTLELTDNRELNDTNYPNYQEKYNRKANVNFENVSDILDTSNQRLISDLDHFQDLSGSGCYAYEISSENAIGLYDGSAVVYSTILYDYGSNPVINASYSLKLWIQDELTLYLYDGSTVLVQIEFSSNDIFYYETSGSPTDIGDYVNEEYFNLNLHLNDNIDSVSIYHETNLVFNGNYRNSVNGNATSIIKFNTDSTKKNYYCKVSLVENYDYFSIFKEYELTPDPTNIGTYRYTNFGNYSDVLTFEDNSLTGSLNYISYFDSSHISGTIEAYIGTNSSVQHFVIIFGGNNWAIYIYLRDNLMFSSGYGSFIYNIQPNKLYHFKLVFDCSTSLYSIYIDGILKIDNAEFYAPTSNFQFVRFISKPNTRLKCYVKNLVYSWNTNYYESDIQYTPESGKVEWGNAEQDIFTSYDYKKRDVNGIFNKTGIIQWGTYQNPNYEILENNSGNECYVSLINEFQNHKNILQLSDKSNNSLVSVSYIADTFHLNNIIEFYYGKNTVNSSSSSIYFVYDINGYVLAQISFQITNVYYYYNGSYTLFKSGISANQLYHIKMVFNDNSKTFDIYFDGILEGDDLPYRSSEANGFYKLSFRTDTLYKGTKVYLDAIWLSHLGGKENDNKLMAGIEDLSGENCNISVEHLIDGHTNILNLTDNDSSDNAYLLYNIPNINSEYFSLDFRSSDITKKHYIILSDENHNIISIRLYNEYLQSYNQSSLSYFNLASISSNQWYNLKIYFNLDTDKFSIWLDSIKLSNSSLTSFDFQWNSEGIKYCKFYTYSNDYSYSFFIDNLYISSDLDIGQMYDHYGFTDLFESDYESEKYESLSCYYPFGVDWSLSVLLRPFANISLSFYDDQLTPFHFLFQSTELFIFYNNTYQLITTYTDKFHTFQFQINKEYVQIYLDNTFINRGIYNISTYTSIDKVAFTSMYYKNSEFYGKIIDSNVFNYPVPIGYLNNENWQYDLRFNNYFNNFKEELHMGELVEDYDSSIGFFNKSAISANVRHPVWKSLRWLDNSLVDGQFLWNESEYLLYDDFETDTTSQYVEDNLILNYINHSIIRVDANGTWSKFYKSVDPFNANGAYFRYVVLKYRILQGDLGASQIFYKTTNHSFTTDYFKYSIYLNNDGNWHTEYFDMYDLWNGGNDWKNSLIDNIRFDFSDNDGFSVEVDFMGLVHEIPENKTDMSIIIKSNKNLTFNWALRNNEQISAWISLQNNTFSVNVVNGLNILSSSITVNLNYTYPIYLRMLIDINGDITGSVSDLKNFNLQSVNQNYVEMPNNPYTSIIGYDSDYSNLEKISILAIHSNYQINIIPSLVNHQLKKFYKFLPDDIYSHLDILRVYNTYKQSFNQFDYLSHIPMNFNKTDGISYSIKRKALSIFQEQELPYISYVNTFSIRTNSSNYENVNFSCDLITDETNWAIGGIFSIDNNQDYFNVEFHFGNSYVKIYKFPSYIEDIWFESNFTNPKYQEIYSTNPYTNNFDFWAFVYAENSSSIGFKYGFANRYYETILDWNNFTGITPFITVNAGLEYAGGFINANNTDINTYLIYQNTATNYLSENINGKINPNVPKIEYNTSLYYYNWSLGIPTITSGLAYYWVPYYNYITLSRTNVDSNNQWETIIQFPRSNETLSPYATNEFNGSDVWYYIQNIEYKVNISQNYTIYNYQGITYRTVINYKITWYYYFIPPEPTLFDKIFSFITPLLLIIIFPLAFKTRFGVKGAFIGFILGIIIYGISGLIPMIYTVMLTILSLMITVIVFKKEGRVET